MQCYQLVVCVATITDARLPLLLSIVNADVAFVGPTTVFALLLLLLLLLVFVFVASAGVATSAVTGAVTGAGTVEVVVVVVVAKGGTVVVFVDAVLVAKGDTGVVIVDAVVDVIGVTVGTMCAITAGVCVSVHGASHPPTNNTHTHSNKPQHVYERAKPGCGIFGKSFHSGSIAVLILRVADVSVSESKIISGARAK